MSVKSYAFVANNLTVDGPYLLGDLLVCDDEAGKLSKLG